jgi:GNAT superfamily N-acetyltransferase
MSLSPDQFRYLIEDNPRNLDMHVRAFHPESGEAIGRLTVNVRRFPRPGGKSFREAETPQIKGAFVHPDYQRQGIGSEMFAIAEHHLGKTPMHDKTVTTVAQAWAGKVGGEFDPEMTTGMAYGTAELRKGLSPEHTPGYAASEKEGFVPPKPRQLAFKGL